MNLDWVLDVRRSLKLGVMVARYATATAAGRLLGVEEVSWARALRRLLEDMGATYIKLGQYLAIRFDLVPKELCDELGKLFEDARPVDYAAIRQLIEKELGWPIAKLFMSFEPAPLAAASIAQVHKAISWEGRVLAVKVQRPGIDRVIAADLRNLRRMASVADALKLTKNISLVDIVEEFAKHTLREVDFIAEAETADAFRTVTVGVTVPDVIFPLCSRRILTMSFVEGVSLGRLISCKPAERAVLARDLDLEDAIHRLASATLKQIFIEGRFHADPHPGNILLGPGRQVGLVDFGIFGHLKECQREWLRSYVRHLLVGEIDQAYRSYENLLTFSPYSDRTAFRREAKEIMRTWIGAALDPSSEPAARHVGIIADRKAALLFKYQVQLDLDTLLFWRTLIVLNGTALLLLPDFDLATTLGSFFLEHEPSTGDRIYAALWNSRRIDGTVRLLASAAGNVNRARDLPTQGRALLALECRYEKNRRQADSYALYCLCVAILALGLVMLLPLGDVRLSALAVGGAVMVLFSGLWWRQASSK